MDATTLRSWVRQAFATKRFDGPNLIWYHLIRNDLRLKLESFQKHARNSKGQT